jgi:predicted outer membrane repeat protein
MASWFSRRQTAARTTRAPRRQPRLGRLRLFNLEERTVPTVFTVLNTNDAGAGSLRQAVLDANANVGPDSIVFDAGVFSSPNTILLAGEIIISDSVTIDGANPNNVIIDGGNVDRIFRVEQVSGQITVNFKNLSLQNGKAVTPITGGADGGAIGITDEAVTIDNCNFTGNSAVEGGAVSLNANGGSLSISNSTFTGNTTNITGGLDGGAINVEATATLSVSNCTLTGNTAKDQGGAIYSTGSVTAVISNSTITGNTASVASGTGGGGGIYFFGSVGNAALSVINSNVSGNQASGNVDGGGIAVAGSVGITTILTVSNTTIDGNTAFRNGGGLAITGFVTTTIENSTISNNLARNAGGGGGGVNVAGTALSPGFVMRNSTVSGNTAASLIPPFNGYGGGLRFAVTFGNFSIQNSTITNNTAGKTGGGVFIFGGRANHTIQSSVVAGNSAPNFNDLSSSLTVSVGNSLIGNVGGYAANDLGGNLPFGASPLLQPLAPNGGLTQTHLPDAGSPLRNTGANPAGLTTDQRGGGFPRLLGAGVDIGAVESVDATGTPVAVAKLPNQTKSGVATYAVTVTYTDDTGINVASIDLNDVDLSGPGLFNALPVAVSTSGSGTSVTATYTFNAPDNTVAGSWDVSDNGVYTVAMRSGEVTDLAANAVPVSTLGQFQAAITQNLIVTTNAAFGAGSLAQAVADANASPGTNDTITFDGALAGSTITLSGELLVSDPLTIVGLGAGSITIDGGGLGRIFTISGPGPVAFSLSGATLTGAKRTGSTPADRGGAIFSEDDPVTLNGVVITGNTSENDGAAVAMTGGNTLTVINSTISNNSVTGTFGDGGGLFGNNGPTVVIQNSTFSGNTAFFSGAGLYFVNAKLTIENSTISGNIARGTTATYSGGGGLYLTGGFSDTLVVNSTFSNNVANFNGGGVLIRSSGPGPLNQFVVRNSTFTANRSLAPTANPGTSSGGGVALTGTAFDMVFESSIVAGNIGNLPDFSTSGAVNFKTSALGSKTGVSGLVDVGGNLFGAALNLGTLANNGGPAQTHLPAAGSPLIGAGSNPLFLTLDQRGAGFPRVVGGTPDIGAVESTGASPVSVAGPFADVTAFGGTFYDFSVTYVDDAAIKAATIGGGNITVTGPNGFSAAATVKTAPLPGDGSPLNIVYSFVPPGGSWDGFDNGFYTIRMNANQVSDTAGNFVAGGTLGLLRVNSPLTLVVNATNDESTDTDGKLSFREAVIAANLTPGLDLITFDKSLFASPQTISLTLGAIQISDNLTIEGPGAANAIFDGAGNGNKRFLRITNAVTGSHVTVNASGFSVQNFTNAETLDGTVRGGAVLMADEFVSFTDVNFTNNSSTVGGGAIAANGSGAKLTLTRTNFTGNKVTGADGYSGGAVRVTTTVDLTVTDSTFENNEANNNSGGAIAALSAGVLIENSTFNGNKAGSVAGTSSSFGGAIMIGGSPMQKGWTIRNSTFTENQSAGRGGAIMIDNVGSLSFAGVNLGSLLTVQNSTITGNQSNAFGKGGGAGGGIAWQYTGGRLDLQSTIVSGNLNLGAAAASDIITTAGTRVSASHSAIGSANNIAAGSLIDLGNNLPFGAALNLGTLANNGGLTKTIALGAGSAAIDAGSNPLALAKDQAGQNRIFGVRPDIGAFEAQAPDADLPKAVVTLPADVTTAGGTTFNVVIDYYDTTGVDSTTIDTNDVTVKGGVFGTPVAPTGVAVSGSGSKVTATYTFAAPSGAFDNSTNGTYTVTLVGGQVTDTAANPVVSVDTDFGTFRSAVGKVFVVTDAGDAGPGTLRQAVLDANASLGVDTITFDPLVSLVTLSSAELVVTEGLTIQGNGAGATTIKQTGTFRVFRVSGPGAFTATFDGVTITGGKLTAGTNTHGAAIFAVDENIVVANSVITGNSTNNPGGGIALWDGANLTLTNSTVSNNAVTGFGGGIAVNRQTSTVTIERSTVSGNTATTNGGGAYFNYGGSLSVIDSTFSGNGSTGTGNGGGGLGFGNVAGTFLIRNSTFSGNSAATHGGGISFTPSFQGTAVIQNSTFTKNTASSTSTAQGNSGGGIAWRLSVIGAQSNFAQLNLDSTIVADNTATSADVSTQNLVVATKSLIGVGDAGFVLTGSGNLTGTKISPLNPLLDPLANNGGPTLTHALKAGSPAFDGGFNPAGLAFDQRGAGFARTNGKGTDIGAFEGAAATPGPTVTAFTVNNGAAQRSRVTTFKVTFSEAVTFPSGIAAAFELSRTGPGGPTGLVNLSLVQSGNDVTITFLDGGAVATQFGSLQDGVYQLRIIAANTIGVGGPLDGDGNGAGGDDYLTPLTGPGRLHRLFGDNDGDADVDAQDFGAFRAAFGGTSNLAMDFDNDGDVDAQDFGQFRARFGSSV